MAREEPQAKPPPAELTESAVAGPAFGQRVIDMKAPLLLRPIDDDPTDKRNWVIKAIERTGQDVEEAIHTWMGGFALEDSLMWEVAAEELGEKEATRLTQKVWEAIPPKYQEATRAVFSRQSESPPFGLTLDIDVPEAIDRLQLSPEETLVLWNRAFTGHDHQMWNAWEHAHGARVAVGMYSRVWERLALSFLDGIKASIGKFEFETTEDLAALNRAYWEAIGCEVEEVENTPDRLVTVIKTCPYFDNMVDMYGKDAASEMMKKTIGPTSANYYQALMKALGLWDTFYVTQDQFRSLGDNVCRMVYTRRSAEVAQ